MGIVEPVIYNNRGKAYFNLEKYEEAIADYGLAIAKKKTTCALTKIAQLLISKQKNFQKPLKICARLKR